MAFLNENPPFPSISTRFVTGRVRHFLTPASYTTFHSLSNGVLCLARTHRLLKKFHCEDKSAIFYPFSPFLLPSSPRDLFQAPSPRFPLPIATNKFISCHNCHLPIYYLLSCCFLSALFSLPAQNYAQTFVGSLFGALAASLELLNGHLPPPRRRVDSSAHFFSSRVFSLGTTHTRASPFERGEEEKVKSGRDADSPERNNNRASGREGEKIRPGREGRRTEMQRKLNIARGID